ncbi:unnamed protein product [Ceratitis capitata]|uniref:(Mediterranean fruit fly) hypothetical protein n=1 Tax=Ceratitis capitata TaxID=7213 RepID=A0A811UZB0_CERCA|nr:unnamed protein product [Ceratitis capitata]
MFAERMFNSLSPTNADHVVQFKALESAQIIHECNKQTCNAPRSMRLPTNAVQSATTTAHNICTTRTNGIYLSSDRSLDVWQEQFYVFVYAHRSGEAARPSKTAQISPGSQQVNSPNMYIQAQYVYAIVVLITNTHKHRDTQKHLQTKLQ